jgi:hypothetical protein
MRVTRWLAGCAALLIFGSTFAVAQDKAGRPRKQLPDISPQVAAERAAITARATNPAPEATDVANHPLQPALKWARDGVVAIEKLDDYSATMVKRERINGKLMDYEQMFVKVRHRPFSVYMYFLVPAETKGQEVIYVEGRNNGNMWAHTVGLRDKLVGTLSLPPTGMIAMQNQRYPLTEAGVLNLVRRLVEIADYDMQFGECEVKFIKNAKINNRSCTCIQVVHPEPRREFLFHMARIFVDDELNIPIRYEAHDWPSEAGGAPELIEEYTYLNLKVNNGFTDLDFDIKNPAYKFR